MHTVTEALGLVTLWAIERLVGKGPQRARAQQPV
jgi:hypothetical protein